MLLREVLLEVLDMGKLVSKVLRCGGVGDESVGEGLRVCCWCGQSDGGRCEGTEGGRTLRRKVCAQCGEDVGVAGVGGGLPCEW